MEKKHIVVIDDEEHILELIKYNLEGSGFKVSAFTSVEEAMSTIDEGKIDTILLDVMLPGIDGISALEKFRRTPHIKDTPILLITAKSEEIDKVLGLELGADDYITKPFSVREVVARVKASVRRNERNHQKEAEVSNHKILIKGLELDIESHLITYHNEQIELTFKEFEILKLLMLNKGRVLTREVILDKVWGYDYYGETRTVDVHIRYLRSKLDAHQIGDYIETVRGVGYKFIKE
ncbi:response regulator transcription factor [Cellulosilyticum sp. I15G10I2]|uniref:response regulator transcription factor n=1 Tax=Cellulosilyticum sp. I15G10I2 TaxID=1892843 RepID=UPI00085BF07F|nr:response regulator transcription factor [Cellulosilyticum sp. I15G10I2]